MKKTILAAFSALALLAPTTMRADEPAKEYNMVITLQNGTTITLGHNDIKNITFNGEEISISGNAANTIEQLGDQTMENRGRIEAIYGSLDELRMLIDSQDSKMLGHVTALEDYVNMNRGEIASLKAYVDSMMNSIANLEGHTAANEAAIATLNQFISDMIVRIDGQQQQIDYLNVLVDELNKKLAE